MVEAGRRHGHSDPRYRSEAARRKSHLRLVPASGAPVEDSGPPARGVPGLEWDAFSGTFFAGRHRHDFEAVKAYEAYRATGAVPAAPAPHRVEVAAAMR